MSKQVELHNKCSSATNFIKVRNRERESSMTMCSLVWRLNQSLRHLVSSRSDLARTSTALLFAGYSYS